MAWGRSPHGERGLKSEKSVLLVDEAGSLPSRGAWIEIDGRARPGQMESSLPSRGAWIEITWGLDSIISINSRSPHGERGLK